MLTQTIFFDFDGTLADSFDSAISIINTLAAQYHFQAIQKHDLAEIKRQTLSQTFKKLGVKWYQLPQIMISARQLFSQRLHLVPVFHAWQPILEQLCQKNHSLIILSSNSSENIKDFFNQHGWNHYFQHIIAGSSLFGKARLIKKTCAKHHINPEQAVYIGDEARDIIAAKQANMTSIAVSWGFQCQEFLQQQQPDHLITEPAELLQLL